MEIKSCDGSMKFLIGYYSEEIKGELTGLYVDELDMRETYYQVGDKFYSRYEVEELINQLENTYKHDEYQDFHSFLTDWQFLK